MGHSCQNAWIKLGVGWLFYTKNNIKITKKAKAKKILSDKFIIEGWLIDKFDVLRHC